MQKNKEYNFDINYEDIFSDDVAVQKAATAYFIQVFEIRDKLQSQDDLPVALPAPGPVHCSTLQQVQ